MTHKPETYFRKKVVLWLREHFPKCHITSVQQMARRGDPDLFVCLFGHFVALELKSENGTPAPLQIIKQQVIREAGGLAEIVYPQNWEAVKHKILMESERWKLEHGRHNLN